MIKLLKCPVCDGTGKIPRLKMWGPNADNTCPKCDGTGTVEKGRRNP